MSTIDTVGHQAADLDILPVDEHRWQAMLNRELSDAHALRCRNVHIVCIVI
jgi:hypothetical protein